MSIFQQYKDALAALAVELKEHSGIDQTLRYDYGINAVFREYSEQLGYNRKDIEKHLTMLNDTPTDDIQTSFTLRELLESSDTASSWLVPRLYRRSGLYILGAAPKSFKSMSMYDLAFSITTSGLYLDSIPCSMGKVIFFQTEEGVSTVKNRLVGRGFDDDSTAMDNDLLRIERSFNIKTDLSRLEDLIKEYDPVLCIFDSLRGISFQLDVSENSVEFSKYIYALQRIFTLHNKTAILIHHKNKTAGAKGLNSLSGSLSIGGASDGIVLMTPDTMDNSKVKIETIPRDGSPLAFIIERQKCEGNRWRFIFSEELNVDPNLVVFERKVIRHFVNISPEYLTRNQLAEALGIQSNDFNLTNSLDRLLESDILQIRKSTTRSGTYEYCLPATSPWIDFSFTSTPEQQFEVASTQSEGFLSIEGKLANLLMKCDSKLNVLKMTADWQESLKSSVWNLLIPFERERLESLLSSPAFNVEDVVGDYKIYAVEKNDIKGIYEYTVSEDGEVKLYENELINI